jgi:hypothetical protein
MRAFCLGLLGLLSCACGGGGQWGHSRYYEPLSDERKATEHAVEYDPVMAQRSVDDWRKKTVAAFGIVIGRENGADGSVDVALSVRSLESRNLCDSYGDENTCRVTVSDREYGRLHALVKLRPEDDIGELSVGARSLVRVVGTLAEEQSEDGSPVLRVSYYRHWPRDYYVTTKARSYMKQ